MWTEWIEIRADLRVLSPLHIGTGEAATFRTRRNPDGEPVEYALIVADEDGFPVIPGSTLKGALRAAHGHGAIDEFTSYLGRAGDPAATDAVDRLPGAAKMTFRNARFVENSSAAAGPFNSEPLPQERFRDDALATHGTRSLAISARTAIHTGRGTAEEGKLFHEQMVRPGALFALRLRVQPTTTISNELERIRRFLAPLCAEDGLAIGSGTTYGRGRIDFVPQTLLATVHRLDASTGDITEISSQTLPDPVPYTDDRIVESFDLLLTGEGPFIVIDSSRTRKGDHGTIDQDTPQIVPLEDPDGSKPILPGESLHGVLRAAALWHARLDGIPGEEARSTPAPRDTRDLSGNNLFITDRLFGCNGWRGHVEVGPIVCRQSGGAKKIVSVKLDRFSMAPIDGGLFETRVHIDPVFHVRITLRDRGGTLAEADRAWFRNLIAILADEGLEVGHGASKGFGWFRVKQTKEAEAA